MKNCNYKFSVAFLLGISFVGRAIGVADCTVWGESRCSGTLAQPQYVEYSFEWSQLPSKITWDAESEDLPLKLNVEAMRAQSLISSQTTNDVNLEDVKIIRLGMFPKNWNVPKGNLEMTNQWFIVFSFWESHDARTIDKRSVVQLLDGQYAQEAEYAETPKVPINSMYANLSQHTDTRSTDQSSEWEKQRLTEENRPWQKLQGQDLDVPRIQWDPSTSAFPLQIKSEVSRVKTYISQTRQIDAQYLELNEIHLKHFTPYVNRLPNLEFLKNLHHWVAVIVFIDKRVERKTAYKVFILLDGSILDSTQAVDSAVDL